MSTDSNAVFDGERYGSSHPVGIAGVESGGDIGGRYVLHDFTVEAKLIPGKRLADICVEIDFPTRTVRQLQTPIVESDLRSTSIAAYIAVLKKSIRICQQLERSTVEGDY
jgi:hypothetical protein